jgi:hypothetical protein
VEPTPFYAHVFLLGPSVATKARGGSFEDTKRCFILSVLFRFSCRNVFLPLTRLFLFLRITHHMSNCVSRFGPGFAEFFCLPMNMFLPSVITSFLGTSAITLIVSILYSSIISNEINIYNIMTCYRLTIMVVSIPISILVSYNSTILLWLNDTYRDGILIW